MVADTVDEREAVTVGTQGAGGLDGAGDVGRGARGQARGEEVVGHPRGRCVGDRKPLSRLATSCCELVRRHRVQQTLADQCVAEPITGLGRFDQQGGDPHLELVVGVGLGRARDARAAHRC